MSIARWLTGDVFDRLAEIPDGTVDLVCTSPPFWRQRAYLPADHPLKPFEIGQEATPGDYIDVMLRLTAEYRRVLSPHGSIAVELGDTMAGSGGAGGDYNPGGFREGQPKWGGSQRGSSQRGNIHRRTDGAGAVGDVLAKSHCGIPEAYRLALTYGHNPITGAPSPAGRWIVRNVVDWCRRNPTPGDDGDKFRRATSDIVCATLNPKRWWDGEAVRVASAGEPYDPAPRDERVGSRRNGDRGDLGTGNHGSDGTRPLYDWWDLASDPYPGAHYAVWPPEIARRLILAMCPQRVCVVCGEPSRRIVGDTEYRPSATYRGGSTLAESERVAEGVNQWVGPNGGKASLVAHRETVGWSDCGHGQWRRGMVLDCFGGSGTTAAVATGHGRDATLIDLDESNLDLAHDRVGMFLEVES